MTSIQTPLETSAPATGAETVTGFLIALQAEDIDGALSMLTDDVRWINVSLPTVCGKTAVEKIFRASQKIGGGFGVHFHNVAQDGDVVLTERTDAITLGRFEHRFWVAGRFELRDGKIAVWRDSFDWGDLLVGFVRALAGLISPKLNRQWPAGRSAE
ncbi:MAG: limonene-1,2-epoxide hydrolase family protein [Solirubrobacterales bacterium]